MESGLKIYKWKSYELPGLLVRRWFCWELVYIVLQQFIIYAEKNLSTKQEEANDYPRFSCPQKQCQRTESAAGASS